LARAPEPPFAGEQSPPRSSQERRREVGIAGHLSDQARARAGLGDTSPPVRAGALSALARMGLLSPEVLARAMQDESAEVRRRACDLAGAVVGAPLAGLVELLSDRDGSVVEAASYALGAVASSDGAQGGVMAPELVSDAVAALCRTATAHPEALCREAATAALGSIGHSDGLEAVLCALGDKPAVRRRAVIALAAFEGPRAEEALEKSLEDADWQVRQAAEDLLGRRARP